MSLTLTQRAPEWPGALLMKGEASIIRKKEENLE